MSSRFCAAAFLILAAAVAHAAPSNPNWTMNPANFVISNTGNVNIKQITWTTGFSCPSRSLGRGDSMRCTKDAATTAVVVKGVPTSGTLPTLVWMGQPGTSPPPPPSSTGCPGYLLGNAGTGYLTTPSGERLTC